MNDPIRKTIDQPLTSEEETEMTRRFSEAYCMAEAITQDPIFDRIRQKISEYFAKINDPTPLNP